MPASDRTTFEDWVRNLHDVFLTANLSRLSQIFVPAGPADAALAEIGGSRGQRLQRCFPRDMWVLWEAWEERAEHHPRFKQEAPEAMARVERLAVEGKRKGHLRRLRAVRHYMSHRDNRNYQDVGRDPLDAAGSQWLEQLHAAFSDLFLDVMIGSPLARAAIRLDLEESASSQAGHGRPSSSDRKIACSAVDEALVGFVRGMELASGMQTEHDQTALSEVLGHLSRGFVLLGAGAVNLWGECVTAMVRRAVIAWDRVRDLPDAWDALQMGSENQAPVMAALVGDVDASAPLSERSKAAVRRTVDWFNETGDLFLVLSTLFSMVGRVVFFHVLVEEPDDVLEFLLELGTVADGLLEGPDTV